MGRNHEATSCLAEFFRLSNSHFPRSPPFASLPFNTGSPDEGSDARPNMSPSRNLESNHQDDKQIDKLRCHNLSLRSPGHPPPKDFKTPLLFSTRFKPEPPLSVVDPTELLAAIPLIVARLKDCHVEDLETDPQPVLLSPLSGRRHAL